MEFIRAKWEANRGKGWVPDVPFDSNVTADIPPDFKKAMDEFIARGGLR